MATERHIALCDVHVPKHSGIPAVLRFIKAFQPDVLILLGDFLDVQWGSHWNSSLFPKIGWDVVSGMLAKDIKEGMSVMADITDAAPKSCRRIYVPGNHEHWLIQCAMTYPGLIEGLFFKVDPLTMTNRTDLAHTMNHALAAMLKRLLDTKRTGWDVLDYNTPLDIGKIRYLHGHQINSIASTPRLYPGQNIVYGHHHTHAVTSLHNSGKSGRAIQHVAVPCLTTLSPGYLRDGSTRWLNGFFVADIMAGGLFDGRVVKVLDGNIIGRNI